MPITTELQENGHVWFIKFVDPWTISELESIYSIERQYRDSSQFRLHVLIDVCETRYIPPRLLGMARRAPAFTHPKRSELAIVGASSLARRLVEAVMLLTHTTSIKFFNTDEEARVHLRQIIARDTAPSLSTNETLHQPKSGTSITARTEESTEKQT
jgi:hypothetical protein